MGDSLIICKTAAEGFHHGKDLKEDISKYNPQEASKTWLLLCHGGMQKGLVFSKSDAILPSYSPEKKQ